MYCVTDLALLSYSHYRNKLFIIYEVLSTYISAYSDFVDCVMIPLLLIY